MLEIALNGNSALLSVEINAHILVREYLKSVYTAPTNLMYLPVDLVNYIAQRRVVKIIKNLTALFIIAALVINR